MSDRSERPGGRLGVTADLEVSVDGASATVRTTGGRAVVDLDSVGDAYRMARAARRSRGAFALLARTDLTVEVRVRGEPVAVIGPDATPGPLSALVGTRGVEVHPRNLLAAGLRRDGR